MTKPHYKPGFYAGDKPYRDCLISALKHFGMTSFTDGGEFFTLGGMEWAEFFWLLDQGIEFGPGSYHNVDRDFLNPLEDKRVIARSYTEFMDISRVWRCPRVICFDSTECLKELNENNWMSLVSLGISAAELSGRVCLNWNYMTGYGNLPFPVEEWAGLYGRWLGMLVDNVESWGLRVELFDTGVWAPKEGSLTPMLSGHCLISI